jgi:threonine synthase
VLVPSAGGDALYGPWKGFRELAALGAAGSLPRMVAVQAAGCDPIVAGWREGASRVPVHPAPRTMALSIADETGGAVSLRALRESGGSAEAVDEVAIAAAMRRIARAGIAAEPASTAAVAAALALVGRGEVGPGEDLVCVLTGAAVKWPEALAEVIEARELIDTDPQALRALVATFAPGRAPRPFSA